MTTNEIEEILKQFKKKFVNYESNDTLVCRASLIENFLYESLLAYGEKVREEERERIKDLIYHSKIRKNERNELMYAVEIDNYNMALDDLLKAIEIV